MDKQEAMAKFEDILQIVEMWANEDIAGGTIMGYDEFYDTVKDNEYNDPMITIWEYYQELTGSEMY